MFSKSKQSNKVLEAIWRGVVHKVYTDEYVIALGGLSINNVDNFEGGRGRVGVRFKIFFEFADMREVKFR